MPYVDVRRPNAEVKLPSGKEFVPDSVRIVYAVDSFPYATVSMHEKRGGTTRVDDVKSSEAAGPAGELQKVMFQARFTPDASLRLFDGHSELEFAGYVSDPRANMSPGSVGNTVTIGHESSLINALRLSSLPEIKGDYRLKLESVTGDLAERFTKVTDTIVSNYESDPTQYLIEQSGDSGVLSQIHETNKKILPLWKTLLKNSVGGVGWPEITTPPTTGTQLSQFNLGVNDAIRNTLKQGTGGFMGTIRSLTSEFQLAFVPSKYVGSLGKFINWTSILAEESNLGPLDFTHGEFSGGSPRILPVSNVIVSLTANSFYRDSVVPSVGKVASVKNIAMWPEKFQGGNIIPLSAPRWFPTMLDVSKNDFQEQPNQTLANYESKFKKAVELRSKIEDEVYRVLLLRYARNYYNYASLRESTASVTIPMDLSIEVGKRYELKTQEGVIGSGFLQRVTHNMHTGGNNSSAATTSLLFSHVEFTGFELPDK